MMRVPYPLRATKISIDLNPFGFWWRPMFVRRRLTEDAKRDGNIIWWARWGWVQISYARWL